MIFETLLEPFCRVNVPNTTQFYAILVLLSAAMVQLHLRLHSSTVKDIRSSLEEPKSPPMLPYRVPILGHTLSFFRSSEALITRGRKYFGDTRRIYSVNLMGWTIYILTNAHHVSVIHNDPATFPYRGLLEHIFTNFGASRQGALRAIRQPDGAEIYGQRDQSAVQYAHKLVVRQTSGKNLTLLAQHTIKYLESRLLLVEPSSPIHTIRNGVDCAPLRAWAVESTICAIQDSFYGPKLLKIDSTLPRTLMAFADMSWLAWYRFPWFMRIKLDQHKRRIHEVMKAYFEVPAEGRSSYPSFITKLEERYREAGIDDADISVLMQFFHWGICMNPANAVFWMISHIVYDPELTNSIRQETAPAFTNSDSSSLDTYYLVNSCPILESVWLECLRVYASVTSMRHVSKDTLLEDERLTRGSTLLFSARQLSHCSVFGDDYEEFNAYRFYDKPDLKHNEGFKPFGGGKLVCPGRNFAKHTACAFIALLLRKYNVSLAFPQSFPKAFEGEPSIGVLGTHDDLFLTFVIRDE